MKKTLLIAIAAGSLGLPASAGDYDGRVDKGYWNRTWQCGDVEVQMSKFAVHDYTLSFSGSVYGLPINFKRVGEDGATLNGKRCKLKPESD